MLRLAPSGDRKRLGNLIPPRVKVSYGTSSQIVIDWLHFRLQSTLLNVRLGSLAKVHHFSKAVTARWATICRLIERFMQERSTNDAFRIHAMLLELTGLTLMRLPRESPQARLAHERLVPALELLDEQAVKHPSLSDIARTVNLSPEHFHRLFHAAFHATPYQYAHARRMTLAKSLLSEGLVSVKEVAERCGYDDPFYFSRVFRHYFGASPGRVRRGLAILGPQP
jgi:AraC-like DNA-binding protein